MKKVSLKILSLALMIALSVFTINQSVYSQDITCVEDKRDFFEACDVKLTVQIGLLMVTFEASVDKNNCMPAEGWSCGAHSCKSPSLAALKEILVL